MNNRWRQRSKLFNKEIKSARVPMANNPSELFLFYGNVASFLREVFDGQKGTDEKVAKNLRDAIQKLKELKEVEK